MRGQVQGEEEGRCRGQVGVQVRGQVWEADKGDRFQGRSRIWGGRCWGQVRREGMGGR